MGLSIKPMDHWSVFVPLPNPEVAFYEIDKILIQLTALVPGHIQETFQKQVVNEFGNQEQLTKGDVEVLQIEGVERLDGDVVQLSAPKSIVNQIGSQPRQE